MRPTPADERSGIGGRYWVYAGLIFLSFAGSIGHVIAATWLLLRGPHGPTYVAASFMISAAPAILLYRVVRGRTGRFDLIRGLAVLDLLQGALSGSLPLLHGLGVGVPRGLVLGQEFLLACCGAFVFPLSRMLLVRVVEPGAELRANSTSAAVFQAGNSAGALQGGLTVAAFGPFFAMGTNALTFLVSAVCLLWLVEPYPKRPAAAAAGERRAAAPGRPPGRMAWMLVGTVALLTVQRLFLGSVGPLVKSHLDGTAVLQGMLQLTFTLGGIAGGLLLGRLGSRIPPRRLTALVLLATLAAFLVTGGTSAVVSSLAACFVLGGSVSLWSVFQTQAQLMAGPDEEREVLARIGFGQSAAAMVVFAVSGTAALAVLPHITFMLLGCALTVVGLLAARALPADAETERSAELAGTGEAGT